VLGCLEAKEFLLFPGCFLLDKHEISVEYSITDDEMLEDPHPGEDDGWLRNCSQYSGEDDKGIIVGQVVDAEHDALVRHQSVHFYPP
jgi:hypothetical protein